jgi:hypothetical protein
MFSAKFFGFMAQKPISGAACRILNILLPKLAKPAE